MLAIHNTPDLHINDYMFHDTQYEIKVNTSYDVSTVFNTASLKVEEANNRLFVNNIEMNNKIKYLIEESHVIDNIKDFKESYNVLFILLKSKKYSTFSNILNNIKIEDSTPLVLSGLLRISYAYKSKIKEWNNFLSKVEITLNKNKDLETKDILQGLI